MSVSHVQVARRLNSGSSVSPVPALQRTCACGQHTGAGGECETCRRKRLQIQRRAVHPDVPAVTYDVPTSTGRPLEPATRMQMESHFRHDFTGVRVHTDAASGTVARGIDAYAFTVGQHIHFAPGQYAPANETGRRLLAHELAHTIQQRGVGHRPQASGPVDHPNAPLEREADAAAAAVLTGTVARVTGRLPAPAPQLDGPGDRTVAYRPREGGRIQVVRTLQERPCRRESQAESTAPGDVIFFDPDANAFGIRYRYCRGSGEIEVTSAIDYGRLRGDAEQLLRRLPGTIASGDVLREIEQTVQQTSISGRAAVGVTVSGTLRAEVRGATEQGVDAREYQVNGLLRLTPDRGWALEIAGGARIAQDLSGQEVTFTFTPRVEIGDVQIGVETEHTERQPVGGGRPTTSTTVRGTVTIPITGNVGVSLSGSSESGGTFMIRFGTIDRPERIERVPQVECYVCVCPPPVPRYDCTTITDPHEVPEVVQPGGHDVVQLHYQYDSETPAEADRYRSQVERVASLAGQNYTIQSIRGFASPEASVAYNRDLAARRAERARGDIVTALNQIEGATAATVPAAEGVGEVLGEGEAGSEIQNVALIRELSARLRGLSEDEQFDLLGIDPNTLDEQARADVRGRIDAFIQGTEEGRRLSARARWEKIFPFLRRVEVTLDRREITRPRRVPEQRAPTTCDTETLQWARENMPPLPPEQRLPTSSGRC